MSTLIYAPSVTVRIATADKTIYDVSADVTDFTVTRSLGISTASFTLANAGRKYDGVFTAMDRIVIYQRRFSNLLTFSGYLDETPMFSTYPGSVMIRASCSVKRLQHFMWDPTTYASLQLLQPLPQGSSALAHVTDGGIAERAVNLLNQVAGWPRSQIHLGAIPSTWIEKISSVADTLTQEADKAAAMDKAIQTLGSDAMINGTNPSLGAYHTRPGLADQGTGTGVLPGYQGKASTFGGPNGGAFGNMGLSGEPGNLRDDQRGKWGGPYYCAMRFPYMRYDRSGGIVAANGVTDVQKCIQWWLQRRILVVSKRTGKAVVVRPADWGPGSGGNSSLSSADGRIIDLSAPAMAALQISTDDIVTVAFADDNQPCGPVKDSSTGLKINSDPSLKQGLSATSTAGPPGSSLAFLETAVNVITQHHPAYVLGATADPADPAPTAFDCSELVQWSAARSGFGQLPRTAYQQYLVCQHISVAQALKTKGALLFMTSGGLSETAVHHVAISQGDGTTIEARSTAKGCGVFNANIPEFNLAGLIQGMDYTNAAGPGTGGVVQGGMSGTPGSPATAPSFGESLFNAYNWFGSSNFGGDLLIGVRALMNDVPIYGAFDDLMTASLRHWCSAPNGDIIGWFPDYFGHYGTAAKMIIQDIEIDGDGFTVAHSDDRLKTHMFVTGSTTGSEMLGDASTVIAQMETAGIASVEFPEIMSALFNVDKKVFADGGQAFLNRYGARVDNVSMNTITGPRQEFFFACFRFMQNWGDQYSCQVPMTYMPELYPGMLAVFPRFGVQAYVQEVTHSGSLADGGGFTTTATMTAWSTIGKQPSVKGLPIGAPL